MKKMKKYLAVGIVLVMAVLMTAGCKKKATSENLLKDMAKNLEKVKSVSAEMKMKMSLSDGTSTAGIDVDLDMESTEKPEASYIKGNVSMNLAGSNLGTDIEMYQVEEKDEDVSYVKLMDQWTRSADAEGEDMLNADMIGDLDDLASSFKLEEKLTEVNGKECFELKGNVKGEDVKDVLNEDMLKAFGASEMIDLDKLEKLEIPCTVEIYKEKILPARVYINMNDVIGEIVKGGDSSVASEEYYVELVYKEFDKVDKIEVPEEAKKAAEAGESENGGTDSKSSEGSEKAGVTTAKPSDGLGEKWDSYTVQINDKVLTLPCEISELEAAGLSLDTDYTPEDYVVNANEYELGYFTDANGNEVMVELINASDKAANIKECKVGGISVYDYELENGGMSVVFPGGIQMGSSLEDVKAAYGDTEEVYEGDTMDMYTWYADENFRKKCEIDLDSETKKVTTMSISAHDL